MEDIEIISDNLSMLDDWEDKYQYLIELGEKLPPLEDKYKTDEWKVSGCQSQVFLSCFSSIALSYLKNF